VKKSISVHFGHDVFKQVFAVLPGELAFILKSILKATGMTIKGKVFVLPAIVEVNEYDGISELPFMKRFAVTDPDDIPKLQLLLLILCNNTTDEWKLVLGRNLVGGTVGSIVVMSLHENHPMLIKEDADPFTIELDLGTKLEVES